MRHLEGGKDHMTAARVGTAEIGLAVLSTSLSIMAVFVPVAFMKGIVGRFFFQFGITVAFSAAPVVGLTNTITVPTGAHTSDANTKLLMHFNAAQITVPTGAHTSDANTKLLMHFNAPQITVPTVAHTADANTKLLCHFDYTAPTVPTSLPNPDANTVLLVNGQKTAFDGHIDEIRVSKGSARWASGFTPPVSEYPGAGGYTVYELATPYSETDVEYLRVVQSTDTLFICHPDYNVRKLQRKSSRVAIPS